MVYSRAAYFTDEMMMPARTLVAATLLAIFVSVTVYSQGTSLGLIRGKVTDATGAVIAGASVEVVDLSTGLARRIVTSGEGTYEADGLIYGDYKIIVLAAGFTPSEITDIHLSSATVLRADARLAPLGPRENISVSSSLTGLQSDNATMSASLDTRSLLALPRDSRDIYSFVYLNPNITQGAATGFFKYAGAQTYGASFSLDGQRSNGGIFGEPTASQPSLEAIAEISILSNHFDAQYAGVANVRVETNRGTQNYHGSLFYNNKNSALAAWEYQDKLAQASFLPTPAQSHYPTPYFNLNEVGGSLGGPLASRKRVFFMLAYERQFLNTPVRFNSTRLPGPRLWKGDFSQLLDSKKPLVPANVTLTPSEIANNTADGAGQRFVSIPSRLLNPVTAKLIESYFPAVSAVQPIDSTTGRLVDYFSSSPGVSRRDLGTMRLDWYANERNDVHLAYNASALGASGGAVVNPFAGLGLTQNDRKNHTVSLSYVHAFANNAINEVRGGLNLQNFLRRSNQTLRNFLTGIGFNATDVAAYGEAVGPAALDTFGHPAINWGSGFMNFGNGGRNTYRPQDQSLVTTGDTLTWIKGRHSIKLGADVIRNAATDGYSNNRGSPRGLINYGGSGPDAFARFLMGLPADRVTYVDRLRPPMEVYNWEHGYFIQDDFKAGSSLTLNLGLRYEISTPFTEKNDILANFDPAFSTSAGKKGRFVLPSEKTLQYIDPRIVSFGYVLSRAIGLPRSLVHTDYAQFGARLGIAFRVTDTTTLRGGYGRYYPTAAAQGMRDAMASNPFNQARTKTSAGTPLLGWPGFAHGFSPMSGGSLNTIGGTPSVGAIPFDLKDPRIDRFNVTLERALIRNTTVRVSYLGSRMHDLISGRDLNMIAPTDIPFGTTTGDGVTACDPDDGDCDYSPADLARQPFPGLGDSMASYGNFGHGRSDALQLELTRRGSAGLTFNASYTLLNQKSTAVDSANSTLGGAAYNQFRPENDYGRDSFLSQHRFVAYSVYEVPSKIALIRNWQVSSQLFIKSGIGFTPYWICDNCGPAAPGNIGSTYLDAVGDFNSNSYRPLVKSDPTKRNGDRIWDASAFSVPIVGADVLDNALVAKRNSLTGPGTWGVNLGLSKTFRIRERGRITFGADFDNVFNHPLFSPDQDGADAIAALGDFSIHVDPLSRRLLPITDVTPNPDFGRRLSSFPQESVESRRTVRLKLRLSF